jgi:hypothetical protein
MFGPVEHIIGLILKSFDGCIVEVGAGSSTAIFNKYAINFKRKFYSCDNRLKVGCTEKKSKWHIPMIMPSLEFMEIFNDNPIVVFLDGNHDYDVVSKEFYFFYERLNPGGVMFMHDVMPSTENHIYHGACSDSYRLRLELQKNPNIDIVTLSHKVVSHGLSIVIKKHYFNEYYPPGEKE